MAMQKDRVPERPDTDGVQQPASRNKADRIKKEKEEK